MVLTLYFHPFSQPSRSVWMFCKAARIPIVEKVVDVRTGMSLIIVSFTSVSLNRRKDLPKCSGMKSLLIFHSRSACNVLTAWTSIKACVPIPLQGTESIGAHRFTQVTKFLKLPCQRDIQNSTVWLIRYANSAWGTHWTKVYENNARVVIVYTV